MRNDPLVRLEDYVHALKFWLTHQDERLGHILFIENSGYSLSRLERTTLNDNPLGKPVEFVSLCQTDYPPGVH